MQVSQLPTFVQPAPKGFHYPHDHAQSYVESPTGYTQLAAIPLLDAKGRAATRREQYKSSLVDNGKGIFT
jgi:hypothetical protein